MERNLETVCALGGRRRNQGHGECIKDTVLALQIAESFPSILQERVAVQGPKKWFAELDKHYPSRSGQTSLTAAETNITNPVTKNNFGPSIVRLPTNRYEIS